MSDTRGLDRYDRKPRRKPRREPKGSGALLTGLPTGLLIAVPIGLLILLGGACSGGSSDSSSADDSTSAAGDTGLEIATLSPRADMVSGGDALLRIDGAGDDLVVSLDGVDVTDRFEPTDGGAAGSFEGVVDGLVEGENVVVAASGDAEAEIELTNHPISGPIFSGAHQEPFECTTEVHGLGPALDDDCTADTRTVWTYVNGDREVVALDDPSVVPADAATAVVDGETVPFVIRNEFGTINRAVYWIHTVEPEPTTEATAPKPVWNDRLVYSFGGGCGTSYSQGQLLSDTESPELGGPVPLDLLEAGYATATATLNTFQVACNDVLSAETAMMVKEHFIETYGAPFATIGNGGSGGAIQQYLIAQNYPGILDGLTVRSPFPDAISIAPGVSDCVLLAEFYGSEAGVTWTDEQRTAVNGHAVASTCGLWNATFAVGIDASSGCPIYEASGEVYDPDANPGGVRCTLQDSNINVFGVDDDTGFARRPIDNVGVQYGLDALNAGTIDVDQFVELNEQIGGFDDDGRPVPERTAADDDVIADSYVNGRINLAAGGLREIPIVTVDTYTDLAGDIHDRFRSVQLLERFQNDDAGRAPNFMVWTRPPAGGATDLVQALSGATDDLNVEIIEVVDEWITNLAADDSDDSLDARLEAGRPDAAVDNCVTGDGERVSGLDIYTEPGPCRDEYPFAGDPRTVAGAAVGSTVLKCSLQSLDEAFDSGLYDVDFTDEQREQLDEVFPDGVCDYTQDGLGATSEPDTWVRY